MVMNKFANLPIVAPYDFFEDSERSLDCALEIATRPNDVHVIHVVEPIVVTEPIILPEFLSDEVREKQANTEFRKRHKAAKYSDIHFDVRFGNPGNQIVELADELKAGLIVMPSHGRTGLRHLLIGSVAERVVRHAKCPVLVLRK
jgi:nucleotide-binding universal stress UspA family protein